MKRLIAYAAFFIALFFPHSKIFAASMFLEPQNQEVRAGESIAAQLFIDTNNEQINAIEGTIIFPENLLKIKEVKEGNSIINFWVDNPADASNTDSTHVHFAGIIPAGYSGKKGLILSVDFTASVEGNGIIEIRDATALLNNGEASQAHVSVEDSQFAISSAAENGNKTPEIKDREAPETFLPEIARDPDIFDGQWFAVFSTGDKISGMDHYEVLESKLKYHSLAFGSWKTSESPHLLKDQKLESYIFIKAIDKNGNKRIEMISPAHPRAWYRNPNTALILLGYSFLIAGIAFIIKKVLPHIKSRLLKNNLSR